MSQWNALNVNVIKMRRIECAKLNLPPALRETTGRASSKSVSSITTSSNNESDRTLSRSGHSSTDFLNLSTLDSINSSFSDNNVFQDSFETPSDKETCFSRNVKPKRCRSLPTYLNYKREEDRKSTVDTSYNPRRLFEEALNLEDSEKGKEANVSLELNDEYTLDNVHESFPRYAKAIHEEQSTKKSHGEQMKSKELSCCDGNNNDLTIERDHLKSTKTNFQSASAKNLDIKNWEQEVLVLTSDYEFGTEKTKNTRRELRDPRSKSVALTENILRITHHAVIYEQNHDTKRQLKSEPPREMPKLQTVVWDYIKRKSTKLKRVNEENVTRNEEDSTKRTNQEAIVENAENSRCGETNALEYTPAFKREDLQDSVKTNGLKSWISTANLEARPPNNNNDNSLRGCHSYSDLSHSVHFQREPVTKELEINPENLTFLLTTASEERSMDERMKTIKQSHEWLLKELKSMRDEDRHLARQFIRLRSAIAEARESLEREDSEGEVECDRTISNCDKESIQDTKIAAKIQHNVHETARRNILSYC